MLNKDKGKGKGKGKNPYMDENFLMGLELSNTIGDKFEKDRIEESKLVAIRAAHRKTLGLQTTSLMKTLESCEEKITACANVIALSVLINHFEKELDAFLQKSDASEKIYLKLQSIRQDFSKKFEVFKSLDLNERKMENNEGAVQEEKDAAQEEKDAVQKVAQIIRNISDKMKPKANKEEKAASDNDHQAADANNLDHDRADEAAEADEAAKVAVNSEFKKDETVESVSGFDEYTECYNICTCCNFFFTTFKRFH